MKKSILLAAVVALTGACSSSTADRPAAQDERRAEIEQEQERVAAQQREDTSQGDAHENDAAETDSFASPTASDGSPSVATAFKSDAQQSSADGSAHHAGHAPDNTGRNERDDERGNLTALDQSNSSSDVDITQAIRKKVVADDGLSFNAKNVKIITVSGKVTLRGPVENAQESSSIEKSARAVPGVVAVDNQIEVKR